MEKKYCITGSPGIYSIRPIQKLLNCQTTTRNQHSAVAPLSSRNNMISIHQRSARTNEAKQRWFKAAQELCYEWFHHFRHNVHDGHWIGEFASHLTSTLCLSLVPWWHPRRIRPQLTRLSHLENSAMGTWPIYKHYYTRLVRKLAWYKILMHVLIV